MSYSSSSSYTVPEVDEEEGKKYLNNDNNIKSNEKKELQSIDDLPNFLNRMIHLSPTRYKKIFFFMAIICQLGFGFTMYTYLLKSPILGLILGSYNLLGETIMFFLPDFTQGVFLDVLLRDAKTTKKINDNMFNGFVSMMCMFPFIVTPLFWWFFVYPLAMSELIGPSTFWITIFSAGLATLFVIPYSMLCSVQSLPDQVSLVHIDKIKKYLEVVRSIVLSSNAEDGITLVDKLSKEQVKVEKWILSINKGISTYTSLMLGFMCSSCVIILLIISSGPGLGAIVLFSIISVWMCGAIGSSLYAIAKPNMVWEEQKILLLNDAKVILNLKFPRENFEVWLNNHNINASKAFGTKITFGKMRQAAGVFTSGFGIILYLLLREEFRGLL